ncbi:hypothetical protein ACFY8X_38845 [Streptomyces tanashiensis]|uniref:hypothetical protein n=1 Tax=Streptomyces tanashiensis TaxID=67367 RepID=UPI0036EC675A
MTTHPNTPTAAVDQALAARAASSGEYLAGILAAAMLDAVGQPDKLPALLCPDLDPDVVERVWNLVLPVGFRMGRLVGNMQWDAAGIRRLRAELDDAGYKAMATRTSRSLATVHPADTETVRDHP